MSLEEIILYICSLRKELQNSYLKYSDILVSDLYLSYTEITYQRALSARKEPRNHGIYR